MRVAVCFSGLTREFLGCWEDIRNRIIVPNNADVFIHTWQDDNIDVDTIDIVARPVTILVEKQIQFSEEPYNSRKRDIPVFNTFSSMYSVWKANELKKEYEKQTGKPYDWVIRCRMDLLPNNTLDLSRFDNSKVWFPDQYGKWRVHGSVEDQFMFGSSENMDVVCDFYNHIDAIWKNTEIQFNCEDMMTLYLLGKKEYRNEPVLSGTIEYGERKVDVDVCDMTYQLIR